MGQARPWDDIVPSRGSCTRLRRGPNTGRTTTTVSAASASSPPSPCLSSPDAPCQRPRRRRRGCHLDADRRGLGPALRRRPNRPVTSKHLKGTGLSGLACISTACRSAFDLVCRSADCELRRAALEEKGAYAANSWSVAASRASRLTGVGRYCWSSGVPVARVSHCQRQVPQCTRTDPLEVSATTVGYPQVRQARATGFGNHMRPPSQPLVRAVPRESAI